MNQRIRELKRQAEKLVLDIPAALEPNEFDDMFIEKFTELVLTEVTDILSTYRLKVSFLDGIEYNCQHPIYAIQNHFGIKHEN